MRFVISTRLEMFNVFNNMIYFCVLFQGFCFLRCGLGARTFGGACDVSVPTSRWHWDFPQLGSDAAHLVTGVTA